MKLNLLADENIDRQVVNMLRADGHDVLYVALSWSRAFTMTKY